MSDEPWYPQVNAGREAGQRQPIWKGSGEQPQEWTRDWVLRNISGLLPDEAVDKLCNSHNAALAAEKAFYRKNYSDLYTELTAERERVKDCANQIDNLQEELAAERETLKLLVDALHWAWSIIANAGGGDWQRESKEWQEAAAKWRDKTYHPTLAKAEPPPEHVLD